MTCPTHTETRMTGPFCVDCMIEDLKTENAKLVKTREAMERLLADISGSPVAQAEAILREGRRV